MSSVTPAARTGQQIRQEIEETFGFFPPFFEPALPTPVVLESLWQQTLSAYLDNPLPAVFKERLNASLSRFCVVPYCMVCHSCVLRPLGMTAQEVLALLERPISVDAGVEAQIAALEARPILLSDFPLPDSPRELALISCSTAVFLEDEPAARCQEHLVRVLGPDLYNSLSLYLAYIKTCHIWVEMHPEISHEADQRVQTSLGPLLAEEPALGVFFQNYQQKRDAYILSVQNQKALGEALRVSKHTSAILESITDAYYALDRQWRFTHLNSQAERLVARSREELLGKSVWDEFPEILGSAFEEAYRRAVREQVVVTVEEFFPPLATWFEVRAFPSEAGLSVFFQDVSERRQVEEERDRLEARRVSEERNRLIVDSIPHIAWTAGWDGTVNYFNQRWYDYAGLTAEESQLSGWTDVLHPQDLERAGGQWQTAIQAGAVSGVELRLRQKNGTYRLHLVRSVSLSEGKASIRWVGTATDIEDHKIAEEALRAAQAQTSGILESITDAFYALDTEWRFTYLNSEAERLLHRTRAELVGKSIWEEFPDAVGMRPDLIYRRAMSEGTLLSFEEFYAPLSTWFEVRVYPSPAGLSVYFQDISKRKALDVEIERLAGRERNISHQLQAALTPSIPEHVPGLALAKFYEAALEEAGVGGDFCDAFVLDADCTALVVGDLSGKGLAAAAQVATVRNMLRYAVYRSRGLIGAVTSLNSILCDQLLLTGFATLFVGVYNRLSGTLTYINCGQEPALIRRASGVVEPLDATGPILGAFSDLAFKERTVMLNPRDALVVFTDGLTEVGRSRQEMLGIEGMTGLLQRFVVSEKAYSADAAAEHLALCLIAGVDAAAQNGLTRDDVCLLIAVAE